MLKSYLTAALRSLRKHPGYTFINTTGLAAGIACCILILLYVQDEITYDHHHEKADRVYRVVSRLEMAGETEHITSTPAPLAAAAEAALPQVEEAVRIRKAGRLIVSSEGERFYEKGFIFASPNVFDVFTLPLRSGNPPTALTRPASVVLTPESAAKYFGRAEPVGQSLTIKGMEETQTFTVTGVLDDIPQNMHLDFDFIGSLAESNESWFNISYKTYLLLRDPAQEAAVNASLATLVRDLQNMGTDAFLTPYLQPLTDIRFNRRGLPISAEADVRYIYVLISVALLVLAIACINYMNLATARAATREREVGVRKVLGAQRGQLARQFLSEATLLAGLALAAAVVLAEALLPHFNIFASKELVLAPWRYPKQLAGIIALAIVVGLGAGGYPALFLSRLQPVALLKGSFRAGRDGHVLRKVLVVAQFAASTVFIIGTLTIYRQLDYIQNKRLGFDKEQVLVLSLQDAELGRRYPILEDRFRRISGVEQVAAASAVPGSIEQYHGITFEGMQEHDGPQEPAALAVAAVGYEFADVLGLKMAEGRWFSKDHASDMKTGFVINKTAAEHFGWEEPLGKRLTRNDQTGQVIGVVEDFHFASLHSKIEPLIFYMDAGLGSPLPAGEGEGAGSGDDVQLIEGSANTVGSSEYRKLIFKLRGSNMRETIAEVEHVWKEVAPGLPFDYAFLDSGFEVLYQREQRLGKVIGGFGMIAILVACLGLFGLATLIAEQRTKEMGMRKVLGASTSSIVVLLSRDFVKLVLVAVVLATPLAYFAMNRWLEDFAYHVEIGADVFLLAGLLAVGIALVTVSFQAIRAASVDPVESLRYE